MPLATAKASSTRNSVPSPLMIVLYVSVCAWEPPGDSSIPLSTSFAFGSSPHLYFFCFSRKHKWSTEYSTCVVEKVAKNNKLQKLQKCTKMYKNVQKITKTNGAVRCAKQMKSCRFSGWRVKQIWYHSIRHCSVAVFEADIIFLLSLVSAQLIRRNVVFQIDPHHYFVAASCFCVNLT